jgi:malonyl-CoA O-methyltransferase
MTNKALDLEPIDAYALWAETYPPCAHNPVMLAEERAMLALLPADLRGCRVLDAGCGSGRYLRHTLWRGAQTAVGVDFSEPMLRRGQVNVQSRKSDMSDVSDAGIPIGFVAQGSLVALPVRGAWADITICALALGHVTDLGSALSELSRVTRPGGIVLCSDFHPIGATLGWTRDFRANGQKYAVRYAAHTVEVWLDVCGKVGLTVEAVIEARLDPADIPAGARFDVRALDNPVALVLTLRVHV